jgi:hypothetical protein
VARILVPGAAIDVPITRHAARHLYERLLRSGVRTFEYQPVMMHAKTFTVRDLAAGGPARQLGVAAVAVSSHALRPVKPQMTHTLHPLPDSSCPLPGGAPGAPTPPSPC